MGHNGSDGELAMVPVGVGGSQLAMLVTVDGIIVCIIIHNYKQYSNIKLL